MGNVHEYVMVKLFIFVRSTTCLVETQAKPPCPRWGSMIFGLCDCVDRQPSSCTKHVFCSLESTGKKSLSFQSVIFFLWFFNPLTMVANIMTCLYRHMVTPGASPLCALDSEENKSQTVSHWVVSPWNVSLPQILVPFPWLSLTHKQEIIVTPPTWQHFPMLGRPMHHCYHPLTFPLLMRRVTNGRPYFTPCVFACSSQN